MSAILRRAVKSPVPQGGAGDFPVLCLEEPTMFNMLKEFRNLFGPWVMAALPKPKPCRILLRLEDLEGRIVPAPFLTTWTDATGNHLASDALNYTNGKPDDQTQLILDGSKTNDQIKFDEAVTCDGILVKNNYSGTMTVTVANVASNATVEIQSGSTPTLQTGTTPLQLTNGAALQVDSGGSLTLDDNNAGGTTFLKGDG